MTSRPRRLPGVLAEPAFARLWIGQSCATLGSRLALTMYPVLVLFTTGSALVAGLVETVIIGAYLGLQVPVGWLVDRTRRKVLLAASDALAGLALLSIALASMGGQNASIIHLCAVGGLLGLAWGVGRSTEMASLPHLLREPELPSAVALIQARTYTATLTGAAVGGALLAAWVGAPFAVAGGLYLVATGHTLAIRAHLGGRQAREDTKSARLDIGRGLRLLWRLRFVRLTALLVAASDLIINGLPLVVITWAERGGSSPASIGLLLALGGAGGLLGAVLTPGLVRRLPAPRHALVLAPLVSLIGVTAMAFVDSWLAFGLLYALVFAPWAYWNGVMAPRWLLSVPDGERGQLQTAIHLVVGLGVPAAPAAAGVLLEAFEPQIVLAGMAACLLGVLAASLLARRAAEVAGATQREGTVTTDTKWQPGSVA